MLFLLRDFMKSMSELGIKMDDYKYIDLCQEYNELVCRLAARLHHAAYRQGSSTGRNNVSMTFSLASSTGFHDFLI